MDNKRNQGIELLRILLTIYICIFHVLGEGGVLGASVGTNEYYIFWFINVFVFCGVNGYALISGYVSTSTKLNVKRIIKIWFETLFYSFLITLFFKTIVLKETLNLKETIKTLIPVLTCKYWYITMYFPLFFLMPYINRLLDSLNEKESKHLFIMLFVIFSLTCIFFDNYSYSGFSFVWLTVCYCLGHLMKKIKFLENVKNNKLVIYYLLCVLISWGLYILLDDNRLIQYVSPTILLCAMCLVVLFSRIDIKSKLVSFISPLCLGIYLFQTNEIIQEKFMHWGFTFINDAPLVLAFLYIIGCGLLVFIVGAVVDYIRILLFKLLKIDCIIDKINI